MRQSSMPWAVVVLLAFLAAGCAGADQDLSMEEKYQADADLVRLEHLAYWTCLIEEYEEKVGHYPLQDEVSSPQELHLVKIATAQQRQHLSPGGDKYRPELDMNASERFEEHSMAEFVQELESGLGRAVEEKYDIQKVPTSSPIGYNYFATQQGYLFWVTCRSCEIGPISTLLDVGHTPTVNIASEGLVEGVPKALTRDEMLSHPQFLEWTSRPFFKEGYARQVVEENSRDSKE